jgi:hypothetical protein
MVRVPCATLEAWRQVATWVEAHFGDCFVAGASSVPQPTAVPAAAPCASRLVASHEVATVPSWHRLDGVEIRTPERAIPVFDACRQHVPARPTADPHAAARIAVDGLLTWLEGGVPWLSLAPLLRRFVSPATYAGLHAWHAADAIDPSSVR